MSRHRSPQSRRAHLGPPLFAATATAGAGGGRSPQLSASSLPAWSPSASSLSLSSLPVRVAASLVVGGTLAAAGQHALAQAVPAAEGANVLRLGVEQIFGADPAAPAGVATVLPAAAAPRAAIGPVADATGPGATAVVADAAALVKAAGLRQAAEQAAAAASAAAVAKVKADEAAKAAAAERSAVQKAAGASAAVAGGVQMIAGRLSSGFGGRWGTVHQGLDIAAPIGTPIHAPLAGTVISSGAASGFGMWVRLQHADGTITVYGHINRSLVSVGQEVQAGDTIAEVGNRGQSTGPHLHIGVMVDGAYVNPRPWLDAHGIGY